MIDHLQTQVVSRSELFGKSHDDDSFGSNDGDAAMKDGPSEAAIIAILSRKLDISLPPAETYTMPVPVLASTRPADDQPEEFFFRLFAPIKPKIPVSTPTTLIATTSPSTENNGLFRINLRPPSPSSRLRQIRCERPLSHYISDFLDGDQLQQLQSIAVNGSTVEEWSRQSWPGMQYTWRVTKVKMGKHAVTQLRAWSQVGSKSIIPRLTAAASSAVTTALPTTTAVIGPTDADIKHEDSKPRLTKFDSTIEPVNEYSSKRKRPGKKKRIAIRMKLQAEKEKQERAKERRKINKKKKKMGGGKKEDATVPNPVVSTTTSIAPEIGDEEISLEEKKLRAARNRAKKLKQREKAKEKKSNPTLEQDDSMKD